MQNMKHSAVTIYTFKLLCGSSILYKVVKEKMKKILCLVLSCALLVSGAVFVFAAEKGDVDGDGAVAAADARLALRASVSLEELTEEQFAQADFDGDGNVTASDARSILRLSVGLDAGDEPPAEDPPPEPEVYVPSERELLFYDALYEVCHPLLGQTKPMYNNALLKNFQKWCCYYTIVDVFRPALEKAGYSQVTIDRIAPTKFSKDSIAKTLSNLLGVQWPDWFVVDTLDLLIPSLLCDYYVKNPDAAETFFLYDYYDDIVETKVYEHSDEDRVKYVPRVGDILFMSNKTRTYENGYPTVDHTAQIIKVYEDGTFLCTEGSIVESSEGDGLARVRERRYRYNEELGTYEFVNNPVVIVLMAAHPVFPD